VPKVYEPMHVSIASSLRSLLKLMFGVHAVMFGAIIAMLGAITVMFGVHVLVFGADNIFAHNLSASFSVSLDDISSILSNIGCLFIFKSVWSFFAPLVVC
jgi:hypothetical protein